MCAFPKCALLFIAQVDAQLVCGKGGEGVGGERGRDGKGNQKVWSEEGREPSRGRDGKYGDKWGGRNKQRENKHNTNVTEKAPIYQAIRAIEEILQVIL